MRPSLPPQMPGRLHEDSSVRRREEMPRVREENLSLQMERLARSRRSQMGARTGQTQRTRRCRRLLGRSLLREISGMTTTKTKVLRRRRRNNDGETTATTSTILKNDTRSNIIDRIAAISIVALPTKCDAGYKTDIMLELGMQPRSNYVAAKNMFDFYFSRFYL